MGKEKEIGNQTEPSPNQENGSKITMLEALQSDDPEIFEDIEEKIEKGEIDLTEDYYEKEEKPNTETETDEEVGELQGQEETAEEEIDEGADSEEVEEIQEDNGEEEQEEEVEKTDETEEKANELIHEVPLDFHGNDKSIRVEEDGIVIPEKFLGEITEKKISWEKLSDEIQLADKQRRDRNIIDKRRKIVQKLENKGITDEELDLYLQIREGNKEVLESFLKKSGIDPYDLDIENAKDLQLPEKKNLLPQMSEGVEQLFNNLKEKDDGEYNKTYKRMVKVKDYLPNSVYESAAKKPKQAAILYEQTRTGNMFKVLPELQKVMDDPVVSAEIQENPLSFWQYYQDIAVKKGLIPNPNQKQQQSNQTVKRKKVKTTKSKPINKKKQKAGTKISGKKSTGSKNKKSFEDYSAEEIKNMSDEEFDKLTEEIEKRRS